VVVRANLFVVHGILPLPSTNGLASLVHAVHNAGAQSPNS
jgi:hypothetical protein